MKTTSVSAPHHQLQNSSATVRTNRLLVLVACLLSILIIISILIFQHVETLCEAKFSGSLMTSADVPSEGGDMGELRARRLAAVNTNSKQYIHPIYLKSPPNMPSLWKPTGVLDTTKLDPNSKIASVIYGGKGDGAHLGGFTDYDPSGLSDNMFDYMMGPLGIKSVIDVGCGKGVSTSAFKKRGANVKCVEGSHDAVTQSLLPSSEIVEHDFSRGPWWPDVTYDAAWCVEFLEHVGRPYMLNYMPVFKKAALLFVTSSGWGGWHHVEVHPHPWWRARFEAQGFVFSEDLTQRARMMATIRNGTAGAGQHLSHGVRVFINPTVAGLPNHHHLFAGHGCYGGSIDNRKGGKECEGADALPTDYHSLLDCKTVFVGQNEYKRPMVSLKCNRNENATLPAQFVGELDAPVGL